MALLPGSPHPLGATWDGNGVNFALYSEHATQVELCLYDDAGAETCQPLPQKNAHVFHGYATDIAPGQRYGYRVHGPYDPGQGLRFNPRVVLLDPYAKAVDGVEQWDKGCFAYQLGAEEGDLKPTLENQCGAPRSVVIDPTFDWGSDRPPRTPLHRSVIYEAHVRGLTMMHPEVPPELRGTYTALGHPAMIRYFKELGITAIELMPIHAFVDDKTLLDKQLRNYWGYNSIGFFALDVRYRQGKKVGDEIRQFKEMVKALHGAGIEVILDVVYNHTAEGNQLGPTFSFKGIDNTTYYRLASDRRYYFDYTGTGNTLNVHHPQVLALVMDSLRYWAEEMHVDGFRFDLASALARQLHEVDRLSSFFTLIHDSPALRDVKLIAEPWDVGEGGYQVGNFPVRWAEWNGKYRDDVRALWKGEGGRAADIGYRLTGSSDLYEQSGRRPSASINFITAHDGFTLTDLVSYNEKHNQANGENNADGNNDERSWNCGVEGPTEDASVNVLRARQRRNLLATLLLSQGTPMVVAGDEFGRTQNGNNNPYCQDNEISWVNWSWTDEQRALFEFSKRVLRIRRGHPGLHRSKFFQGRPIYGTDLRDVTWFRPDGEPMSGEDWGNPGTQCLVMFLAGRGIDDVDDQGWPLVDDNLLLVLNASHVDVTVTVPRLPAVNDDWQLLIDTARDGAEEVVSEQERTTQVVGRSLKLFRSLSRVVRTGGARHTFSSTYRFQLRKSFGFDEARGALGYLRRLGISSVYTSPILAAVGDSIHGYDVVDHKQLSPDLGNEEQFAQLSQALSSHGMGLLVDWVPNHMGITIGENVLWEDVLENGPSAVSAEVFDIDWNPATEDMQDTVLLPVLGKTYGQALEDGEIRVEREGGAFYARYFEHRLPLGPKSLLPLFGSLVGKSGLPADSDAQHELESILRAMTYLPDRRASEPGQRRERAREKEVIKKRVQRLLEQNVELAEKLAAVIEEVNGTPGIPASFDALDQLLRSQSYRLASWRVAGQEINYRRFFDVNVLAAIRMERPHVFEQAHRLLFRLIEENKIQGVRLDHIDGLYDPLGYLEAVQRTFAHWNDGRDRGPDDRARPLPVWVEKILESGERLPAAWPVDGTTGYEFAASVGGLWVDPSSEERLTSFYRKFTGDSAPFEHHVYQSKMRVLKESLASEVTMLARRIERITRANRRWRDFTLTALTRALIEILACYGVYRTYLREGSTPSDEETSCVLSAIEAARTIDTSVDRSVYDFLASLLLMKVPPTDEEVRADARVAMRFQQLTGAVMAKAVEDTAFYRFTRLVSLNEVGGDPARFGTSLEEFHAQNRERARSWPFCMLSTSTHDTKRGEDARARIALISEFSSEWVRAVARWSRIAAPYRKALATGFAPQAKDEYLLYQSLLGGFPPGWDGKSDVGPFTDRVVAYMEKATREAKQRTSWTNPDEPYDEAVRQFCEQLLADPAFVRDFVSFCSVLDRLGAVNGLAQTLLRVTCPGIPDTYQGTELWDQSFVDPDNRREIDYAHRSFLLAAIEQKEGDRVALCRELLGRFQDGAIKLYVLKTALSVRRLLPKLFHEGDYQPIIAGEHVIAFRRALGQRRVVVAVPRHCRGMLVGEQGWPIGDGWGSARIPVPSGTYRDAFTDSVVRSTGSVSLADLFRELPLALLVGEGDEPTG